MKAFLRTFFAALLAFVVVLAALGLGLKSKLEKKTKIKDHSYLVVDIYGEMLEYDPPGGSLASLMSQKPETLQRIIGNLEKACVDDRIDGVIMKISASNTAGVAKLEEIRNGVKKVQEHGKEVYAYTDYLDFKTLFLASACDSIYMPNEGITMLVGLSLNSMHVKGTLDKLGIKPNIHKIKEYKSAAELVTRKNLSPEARENYSWMLDEFWEMMTKAIEADRGITEQRIVELMNHALFTASEAKEAGIVDAILYWPELEERLKKKDDERLRTVSQARYAKENPEDLGLKGKKKIAIVHAQGMIGGRKNRISPMFGVMMGHESMCEALRKAARDDDVAAIVFRVDSRGGEGLASDIISHELEVISETKPVVVSMVDVAASGGYMISYRASKIVADPTTITGSIGSISGKFNMKGFDDKIGVTHDHVTKGPMALLWAEDRDFTPEERARFEENHWASFNAWLADVAKFRHMSMEEAQKLAYGRVWSGRQAKENGLIDELGGLDKAIALAKELSGVEPEEKVTLVHYPKARGLLATLLGGDGLPNAVKMVLYRMLREDASHDLAPGPLYMIDEIAVR